MLVAGGIGVVAVPTAANAATTDVNVSPGSIDLQPGDSKQLTVKVSGESGDTSASVAITLAGLGSDVSLTGSGGVNCSGTSCSGNVPLAADNNKTSGTVTIVVVAKSTVSVAAGSTANGSGTASSSGKSDNFTVVLHGPAQTQPTQGSNAVPKITGVVKDSATGQGIAGVKVVLQDDPGTQFTTTSNNAGGYSFTSTSAKPIIAGQMAILATKEGYTYDARPFNTTAGQAATFDIVMQSTAPPTASASAPEGGISSAPSDSGSSTAVVPASSSGGSNHYLTFMIIAGGLLILAGIGAILTLVLRRRNDDDDDEDDDEPSPPRRRPPPQGRPAGGYRAEPTVVARDPGYNDRTAVVRPIEDEYPDPYGAPPPRSPVPAHGGQRPGAGNQYGNQYGGAPNPGYDQPTTYTPAARPAPDQYAGDGYGQNGYAQNNGHAQGGGEYGRGSRYDEPTGVYNGGAGAGEYGGGQYGAGQYGGGQYGAAQPEPGRAQDSGEYGGQHGGGQYGAGQYGGGQYGAGQYGAGEYGGYQDDAPPADPYRTESRHGAAPGYVEPAPAHEPEYGAPRGAAPRGGYPQQGQQYGGYDQAYDPRAGYDQGYGAAEPRPTSGAPRPTSGAPRPTSGAPRPTSGAPRGGYPPQGQQYGGYDQAYNPQAGYEQQGYDNGSRHSAAPARSPEPRRSLDWLDD